MPMNTTMKQLGDLVRLREPRSKLIVMKMYLWMQKNQREREIRQETLLKTNAETQADFRANFEASSDEDAGRFRLRTMLPNSDGSGEDAAQIQKERQLKRRMEAQGQRMAETSGWNNRSSPDTSSDEQARYNVYQDRMIWQRRTMQRRFHSEESYWSYVVETAQADHKTHLLREGTELYPNAPVEGRGFQANEGPPAQQWGEAREGLGPHTLSNRVGCNPYFVGTCGNCGIPCGGPVGNKRVPCYNC